MKQAHMPVFHMHMNISFGYSAPSLDPMTQNFGLKLLATEPQRPSYIPSSGMDCRHTLQITHNFFRQV